MHGQRCLRHSESLAERLCDACGDPICQQCTFSEGLELVCRRCANELQERRALKRIGMVVALTVVVGLGLAGRWAWQERARFLPEPEVVTPPPDYGAEGAAIRRHREALAADPCNRKVAKQLADRLNRAGAYEETIEHVASFEAQCGVWHRLLWGASYAHRKLRQWPECAAVITRIIENEPDDSDYWWWRGRANAQAGELDRAEADFRQSMANRANGWAAKRFDQYLGDTRPCGAAFALQHWIDHGERWDERTKSKRTRYYLEGNCQDLEGRGRVHIAIDDPRPVPTEEVIIGGAKGQFLLDERSAYVVLTREFAERAGVVANAPVDPVFTLGALVPATTGVAESVGLGKASADQVPVAVTDALPGDIDGVVGLSFLWRFSIENDASGWTFRAR